MKNSNRQKSMAKDTRRGRGRAKLATESTPPHDELTLPAPQSKDFAYLVATRAWRDGLTANAICRSLFDDSSPVHLMQVKRALKRACQEGLFELRAPESTKVQEQLSILVNSHFLQGRLGWINVCVVEDSDHTRGAPVYVKAADLIAAIISQALAARRLSPDAEQLVVCNAGGRTVSETVRALARNPPVLDYADEAPSGQVPPLLFVAGNAAYQPKNFHHSANFLSVTMAELFRADHFALPKEDDSELTETHARFVERATLFICGAGTCEPGCTPGLMAQYLAKQGYALPARAIGDLAFNLLDKEGNHVELADEGARKFMNQLNPSLTLLRLKQIAENRSRILVVLDAENPREKTAIGTAILKKRYATDVVLGTRLGTEIIREWQRKTI